MKENDNDKGAVDLSSLGTPGPRLSCNNDIADRIAEARKVIKPFDERVRSAIHVYEETKMRNQVDSARMPTKVRGQFVARLQNELMDDLVAQQFCAMDTINFGESYQYSTLTRTALPIYKMSEPGSKPISVGWSNEEGVVDLGAPICYTSEEFRIPHFNRHVPDKWVRELDRAVTWAKEDLAQTIDTDIWTMLDSQISGGLNQTGFSYMQSRVKNIPTSNNLVLSTLTAGISKQAVQDLLLHGLRMDRRLVRTLIPTLAIETLWDWVESDTYHPRISEQLQAEIERSGARALTMWGYPVIFQTVNVLEGSTAPLYAYASYEALKTTSVPGACFYVASQTGEDDAYDALSYIRTDGAFDWFVAKQWVLLVAIDLQKPNIAKLRYK